MRIESSLTSISWIPEDAVEGMLRLAFYAGMARYDPVPPAVIHDLPALAAAGAFRFANELRAWIEVDGGEIVASGHAGGGHVGRPPDVRADPDAVEFVPVQFPDLRPPPQVRPGWVRFVQTTGGRPGVALPMGGTRRPYPDLATPPVWTTLALTIHADGATEAELAGASPFPRHWLYDHQGKLVQKSGVIDFESWNRQSFGRHNPWGGEDAPVVVTAVESALERALSPAIIAANPPFQRLKPGQVLVEQGAAGGELFLLFDGILAVEVDGRVVAQVGPGAIVGEMALVDSGRRTATLRAVTPCRVAAVRGDRFADRAALEELARRRRGQPDPQPDAKPDGQADAQPGGGAED